MGEIFEKIQACLREHDLKTGSDGRLTWTEDSKSHPRNWSAWSKCYTAIVVIWLEAYMTAISTAGTATSEQAVKDYSVSSTTGIFCFVTIYLLGQCIGGICLAPISEIFGRRTIYVVGSLMYGIFSVITGIPNHLAAAAVGRFFQGFAAAIPATVAFGNFSDMYDTNARVWVVYWYTLFGMAGLAIGPIYSSYVTELLGWRWVYHFSAMLSAGSTVACFCMRESNASQLLKAKVDTVRKITGNNDLEPDIDNSDVSVQSFMQDHVQRPLQFLFTEPVVTLCAILCSVAFSLLYAATESLSLIYTAPPFSNTFTSKTVASLAFIPILIGELLNILPRIYDTLYLKHLRENGRQILPESKIHSFAIACPALAVGLWIMAWTVPQEVLHVPWGTSMIGLVLIGFAANDFSYVLFGYVTDAYGPYAASAVSAVSTARSLAAALFPLFVTAMYKRMGNNYATMLLAIVATLFCFTPWLFLTRGRRLRQRSKYATKDKSRFEEENNQREE